MTRAPTDLEILNAIYERYYATFASFSADESARSSKVYVPIDIAQLAKDMSVDEDIVFGRLYYHLDKKYGYKNDDGSYVHLFALVVGGDRHCVNFPYVASVLASLREENRKYRLATTLAIVSLFISVVAFLLSVLGKKN